MLELMHQLQSSAALYVGTMIPTKMSFRCRMSALSRCVWGKATTAAQWYLTRQSQIGQLLVSHRGGAPGRYQPSRVVNKSASCVSRVVQRLNVRSEYASPLPCRGLYGRGTALFTTLQALLMVSAISTRLRSCRNCFATTC